MTVLQVCAYAAPYEGNFIKSLLFLKKELMVHGHSVIFAFPNTAKDIPWVKKICEDTDVYFLPLAKAYIIPETYRTLTQIYKKHTDIEVVHSHFELYDIPVERTAPKKVKVFWHLHDAIEAYSDLKNKVLCKLQYGVFYGRAELLSVSTVHMEYAAKLGFPGDHMRYFPNGIDLERIEMIESNPFDREFDFLMFGWDYEIKGVDLCINAVNAMNNRVRVAIVCNDNVKDRIIQEFGGIPKNITLLRPESNVNCVYNRARCFLHISRFEGLSYALLEAVFAGLPVICSDIKANQFARVFPSVSMVESENVSRITEAMNKMMDTFYSGETSSELIGASRAVIETEYSVSRWVEKMLKCYGVIE